MSQAVGSRRFDHVTGLAFYSEAEWSESIGGIDEKLRVLEDPSSDVCLNPFYPVDHPHNVLRSFARVPTVDELRAVGMPGDATIQANLDRGRLPREVVERRRTPPQPLMGVAILINGSLVSTGSLMIAGGVLGVIGLVILLLVGVAVFGLLAWSAGVLGALMMTLFYARRARAMDVHRTPNPLRRAVRTFVPAGREGELLIRADEAIWKAQSSRAWHTDAAYRTQVDLVEHMAVLKSRCRRTIAIRERLRSLPKGVGAKDQVKMVDQVLDSTEALVAALEGYAAELDKLDCQIELLEAEDCLVRTSDELGDLMAETGADVHQMEHLRSLGTNARARAMAIAETRTRLASHVLYLNEQVEPNLRNMGSKA